MSKSRTVLDEGKKREILAIIGVGCSKMTAARYVGCCPQTIRREAERDPDFGAQLSRAMEQNEVANMTNIQNAGKKAQYWRAAAWALERCYPERYASRSHDSVSMDQVVQMVIQLAEVVSEEVPIAKYRQKVVKRFHQILDNLRAKPKAKGRSHGAKKEESDTK